MDPVVLRSGRGSLLVVLAAAAFIEVGLVAGLVTAVRSDEPTSAWGLVGVLALLLGIGIVLLVPRLVRPTTVTVSDGGYRLVRGRAVVLDLPREELTAVAVVHEHRSTRIDLAHDGGVVSLAPGPRWRESVAIVRDWARADPSLVTDEETRAFLLAAEAPTADAPRRPSGLPGLVRQSIHDRDPWAPFLPDAYGEYSAWWGGRFSAARAPERGSTLGLVWRWALLVALFLPVPIALFLLVRLVSLAFSLTG